MTNEWLEVSAGGQTLRYVDSGTGHRSTFSSRGFSAGEIADDVALLLDGLGESSAIVIGHDWGASATYGVATKHPDQVSKMVTLGIPHPSTLKPSLGAAIAGRHFVWSKFPWAAPAARLERLRGGTPPPRADSKLPARCTS